MPVSPPEIIRLFLRRLFARSLPLECLTAAAAFLGGGSLVWDCPVRLLPLPWDGRWRRLDWLDCAAGGTGLLVLACHNSMATLLRVSNSWKSPSVYDTEESGIL